MRTDLARKVEVNPKAVSHSRIFVPVLRNDQLIAAVFAPIARDGAGIFEVGVRIQKALKALKAFDPDYQIGCDLYAKFAKESGDVSLKTQFERDLVSKASRQTSPNVE